MAKIEMTPAKGSSSVAEHGYDAESRTLRVKFKTGATYDHPDVPLEKYAAMTGSNSVGNFYNTKIRNHHAANKLRDGK